MSLGIQPDVEAEFASRTVDFSRGRRLSVCHLVSGDRWAGAETQVAALLRVLAQKENLLVSAVVLNDGKLVEQARRCGIEVKVLPERQMSLLQILGEASRYLRARNTDIVHSHRYKENFLAAMLARRCRVPVVVRTQHGLPEPFVGSRRIKQALIHSLDRFLARHATDSIVSVSSEMRQQLIRWVAPERVVTIPNGIDTALVSSKLSVAEAKNRLGLPRDFWVLGSAGRLEPIKRLDIFIAAANQIASRISTIRFLIVGEGREEANLRRLVAACGLQERVLFLGHRQDIYDVLRAFDIFVQCSDHEGLPMVLLEALQLGVPIVARNVGGVSEVVQHGSNGLLVLNSSPQSLAESCEQMLHDPGLRARCIAKGHERLTEAFTAERNADATYQLYARLCEAR